MEKERIIYLLERFTAETITREELEELRSIVAQDVEGKIVPEVLQQLIEKEPVPTQFDLQSRQGIWQQIVNVDKGFEEPLSRKKGVVVRFWKYAAAAAVVLVMATGAYFYFNKERNQDVVNTVPNNNANDVAPGTDKAILTLADGRQIVLDSIMGNVASQGGVSIINQDGQLSYEVIDGGGEVFYNTIITPRGGQYQIVLADGTKVWLNAASSLQFPTAFRGADRKVKVTGEVYFEVSHDPSKPFIVSVNNANGEGQEVEVLGTHFNINAYDDEGNIKTTLLEGKVRVATKQDKAVLIPGQQAVTAQDASKSIKVVSSVDTDAVVAWKNGQFSFKSADLPTVMRQLSRWYDIEVVYEGKGVVDRFTGSIPRHLTLAQVIKVLQLSDVQFEIQGRKMTVRY